MYRDVVDIMEQAGDRLDTILVPKVGVPADLYMVEAMVSQIESRQGLHQTRVGLEALIETALGMANVEAIAAVPSRLEAHAFRRRRLCRLQQGAHRQSSAASTPTIPATSGTSPCRA